MKSAINAGWVIAVAAGSIALVACVDGAPKDKVGTAMFGTSRGPLTDDSAFADGDDTTAGAGMGANGTKPKDPQDMGSGGSSMMTAGTGGGAMPMNTGGATGKLPGSGGMGGMSGAGGGGAGMSGAGGATGSGGSTSTGSSGALTVTFTSVSQGGRYSPQNVGAVWIETGSGTFVKTLERWAGIRASHLSTWAGASGGWGSFFGGGNEADKMDAISKATMRDHQAHMLTWDMKDLMGQIMPDGKYKVWVEVADDNFAASGSGSVEFDKGPGGASVMAPDQAPFTGMVLSYKP